MMVVKRGFGCTRYKRCICCEKDLRENCTNEEHIYYERYMKQLRDDIKKNHSCPILGRICSLNDCSEYLKCEYDAKKYYQNWYTAYKRVRDERLF